MINKSHDSHWNLVTMVTGPGYHGYKTDNQGIQSEEVLHLKLYESVQSLYSIVR